MAPPGTRASDFAWRPLVVCVDAEMYHDLRAALADLGIADILHVAQYPAAGAVAALAARQGCNICFLDVSSNQEVALLLIAEASAAAPVVALSPSVDAGLILRCLRRGACEFLSEIRVGLLENLFQRLAKGRAAGPPRAAGATYCVVPGKPGCGATTLAVNLAVRLGSAGGPSALLADTDFLTGSIGFMLKLKSGFHLGNALADWERMDDDLWRRLTVAACGIDVLLAPESPSVRLEAGSRVAGEFVGFARERYEAVVVDTPDARTALDAGFAAAAEQILLVTTNELAALHATRRALECFGTLRDRIRLIVNRYTPATGLKREDLKTALQVEPFAILSNDYEAMQTALLEGKPAPASSRFGASVRTLCAQLGGAAAPQPAKRSWLRVLSSGR